MKPSIKKSGPADVFCKHETLGKSKFYWGPDQDGKLPELLFTENETNSKVKFKKKKKNIQRPSSIGIQFK